MRKDGRAFDDMRPVTLLPGFLASAHGSALITCGNTRVLCTAMLEEKVPPFKAGSGQGWLTAEYAMLPASTPQRKPRERSHQDGRSVEIQRLIGRSLRACLDFTLLGERTITIDCDVLQADGGTRTASITGGFVALAQCIHHHMQTGLLERSPLIEQAGAISCGVVDGQCCLDLPYEEDSRADVDLNLVMLSGGGYVEVQGTGEHASYSRAQLGNLLDLAEGGIRRLFALQRAALEEAGVDARVLEGVGR
nr:ribonuclease PH [bacterium]